MKNFVGEKLFILPSNIILVIDGMWIHQTKCLSYWRKSLMGCEFIKQNVRLLPHIHWRSQGSKSKGQHGKLQVRTTLLFMCAFGFIETALRLWPAAFLFFIFIFVFTWFGGMRLLFIYRTLNYNDKCWLLHTIKVHLYTVHEPTCAETSYDFRSKCWNFIRFPRSSQMCQTF